MIFEFRFARVARGLPIVLFVLTLFWYGALVFRYPAHGAIGDDPATYVQMALDLAQRGSVVHEFPLFTKLFEQGFSWDAFITPGYHIVRETGFVAPNFAFGFPMLLAFAYRVFGENALYWTTPLLGALSLVMTFVLANELFRDVSPTRRYWIGAFAVLLLATTPKQIQLTLVPMSDVPTQLFCVCAVWCALRVWRLSLRGVGSTRKQSLDSRDGIASSHSSFLAMTTSILFATLCGLSLGIAYLIRHSALVMIIPLAIVASRWGNTRREKLFLIFVTLLIFAITVAPDFIYRAQVLGSPFAVESPESAQVNVSAAPRQILQMLAALFSVTGFGPIVLLVLLAWWLLWREKNKFAAAILSSWILAFMLFHAPLALTGAFENNLRYLLPAYPAIVLAIAYAVVWIAEFVWKQYAEQRTRYSALGWLAYFGAGFILISLALSVRALVSPERFAARAYGWLSETARNDLNALNGQLPRDSVIGVSDQMAGATLLYAQREIFRPNNFLDPAREFPQFLQELKNENRAVFLLGDWNCAGDASERLPQWLGEYEMRETGNEIRDLPYECSRRLYRME